MKRHGRVCGDAEGGRPRMRAAGHRRAAARLPPLRRAAPTISHLPPPQVQPYKAHRIDPPGTAVTTTKTELMHFFETMFRMRRLEIAADMQYKAKMIRGFCHL